MGRYISFAKLNKKYLYLVFSILFLILEDIAFGYNYNDSFKPLFEDNASENFSEHYLIKNICCYIVTFILSLILYIKERKLLKISDFGDNSSFSSSNSKIKYIYHDNNAYPSKKKTLLNFLFIVFIWILNENLIKIFSFLKDLDFWMIEIIIISYMTSIMFKTKIYRHHKLVIFLNLIPVLFKIIVIILSFQDECNKDNNDNDNDIDYYYNYNFIDNSFNMCLSRNEIGFFYNKTGYNLTGGLKNYYVKNAYLVPIGIFAYIILITLRSYINSSIKWSMDLEYISEKKLLMIYGLIGAIICSIPCYISTFYECKNENGKAIIFDYICKVKHDYKLYFDSFIAVYKILKKKDYVWIIKTIFGIICFYFNKYFSMLTIKYFTPIHLIFSFPVYYFTQKIVLIINTLIQEQSFFSANRINFIEAKFSLDILGDILSSIGFLIYLEIIELNFCGLNYYLRRKMPEKAYFEEYGYLEIEDDVKDENENEKKDEKEMINYTPN